MKVTREDLDGTQVQRLVVTDPRKSNHHVGEVAGYICPECLQADETLSQIYHNEDCSLAGEHGRDHYDELVPDIPGRPTPEFDESHPITVVECADTEGRGGLHEGEVLAFQCECGNLDEDLFEVVHDERCELSDNPGPLTDHDDVHVSPPSQEG
ncbi:hypothetical protein [Halosimplex sp. J119]